MWRNGKITKEMFWEVQRLLPRYSSSAWHPAKREILLTPFSEELLLLYMHQSTQFPRPAKLQRSRLGLGLLLLTAEGRLRA